MPKAAVLMAYNEPLVTKDIQIAPPGPGEVKVKIAASGVCHSDLSVKNLTMPLPVPIVLGHEGAGVVTEVGQGVTQVAEGDHVVISWVPQCGECFFCTRGQGYLCEAPATAFVTGGLLDGTTRFSDGDTSIHQMACSGTFSEETIVPAIGCVKIPDDVPLARAALIGCGVQTGVGAALNTADISEGDTVAVVGCGGVGLNVIQGAKLAGAAEIIAIDMVAGKLEMAKKFGATQTVDASETTGLAGVMELTGQRGADVAFEVIGLKQTIDETINMTRRGGQAILVGVPAMDVMLEIPANLGMVIASKTVKGCWYGSSNVQKTVPQLLQLHRDGKLMLDELISRTITINDVNEAFEAMEKGEVARSVIEY